MFYYYGRKKRISHLYSEPKYDKIIEPFCGSGAYSLHGERWKRNVELYDTSPVVKSIWEYLLNASQQDIKNLPVPEERTDIRTIAYLSEAERNLMGFAINAGSAKPCNIVTHFSRWKANKQYIYDNLYKIKHWKFFHMDYREIKNEKCSWFIDPPYKKMGVYYQKTGLDYEELSKWILNRKGQIIACEGVGGDYLPFVPLIEFKAIGKRVSKEFVYIKE